MVRPKLTQQRLEYARHQPIYMAVIADLAYAGVINKEKAEEVMGWEIPDYYPESIESIIYKKSDKAKAPVASVASGTYTEAKSVTLTSATEGATIKYTVDGSDPRTSETAQTYAAAITISSTTTLKAVATKADKEPSPVSTYEYTIALPQVVTPTATPAAGAVASGTTVALATTTAGATIYYTDDGTEPTAESGTEYTAEIEITDAVTIKAIAVKDGMTDSDVLTAAYTISE